MVKKIQVTSVLNKHKKRDDWFMDDYSVNPYSGCPFNCLYCYIRGSRYGRNMAKTFAAKINAPELLEKQLARRSQKGEYGIIALASATEAYSPQEKELELTRKLLEIILKYRFPVEISTKSTLIVRDLDLFKEIDQKAILPKDLRARIKRGAIISFSFSTLNERLAKILEPGAPPPRQRLATAKKVKKAGLFTGFNFMPVLPYLTDSEADLEKMTKAAKDYQADFVFVGGLTLFGKGPADSKILYYRFLKKHFPDLVPKYKSLYRIFFAPPKTYQAKLESTAKRLCQQYQVNYGL